MGWPSNLFFFFFFLPVASVCLHMHMVPSASAHVAAAFVSAITLIDSAKGPGARYCNYWMPANTFTVRTPIVCNKKKKKTDSNSILQSLWAPIKNRSYFWTRAPLSFNEGEAGGGFLE